MFIVQEHDPDMLSKSFDELHLFADSSGDLVSVRNSFSSTYHILSSANLIKLIVNHTLFVVCVLEGEISRLTTTNMSRLMCVSLDFNKLFFCHSFASWY